jgi:hypothetical protein
MNCAEARIHVSALHDGEALPVDATQHIRGCNTCRRLLQDFAEMGAEIRLLASELEGKGNQAKIRLHSSLIRRPIGGAMWSAQVRLPRFAVALGLVLIAGLTAGLVFLEAQGRNQQLWFRCELVWPQAQYKGPIHPTNIPQISMGFGPQAKSEGPLPFFITGPGRGAGTVAGLIEVRRVQSNQVTFSIRARHFDALDTTLAEIERTASPPLQAQKVERILSDIPAQEYNYKPGTTLKISVGGGESLIFKGEIGHRFSRFTWQQFPLQPAPDQLVLDQPALVPEAALLVKPRGMAKISGPNGCDYIYVPEKGLLILALHPFPGAHEAAADGGHVLFELDHKWYYVFSQLPMIGGNRPKTIWVYLARDYKPSVTGLEWDPTLPFVGSAESLAQVLEQLKK